MHLGGRYELREPIASGGMAQVWLARDTVLDRTVAAKILHPHLATDAGFVERFRREAIAAARLSHSSIVSIFDTISANGVEAIVMELIEGRTLRAVLDEVGAMPIDEVIHVGISIASALDEAHRAGIVHRDIKPANIMVSSDRRVLVTDFGIAKAGSDSDLTVTGTLLGTAKYLAPEQVTGAKIDPRSDLYSLGVVLFEALTGSVPFRADTDAATALARLHQDPPPVRQLRPNVPPELEAIVAKLMARDPDGRFPRASALHEALIRLRANNLPTAPPSSFAPSPNPRTPGGEAPSSISSGQPGRPRPPDPPAGTVQGPPVVADNSSRPMVTGPAVTNPANSANQADRGHGPGPIWRPPTPPPSGSIELLGVDRPIGADGGAPVGRVVRSRRTRLLSLVAVLAVAGTLAGAALGGLGPFESGGSDEVEVVNPLDEAGPGLAIAQAHSFDPLTADDEKLENEDLVPRAIDGDPSTAWRSERYRQPGLSGKQGVGLLLELGQSLPLNRMELVTNTEGWVADFYVGETFGPDPASWGPPVATVEGGSTEALVDLKRAEGSVVLLWIRDTGTTDERFRFELAEVVIR